MRAVVLTGQREASVETVDDAVLEAPTDALLRITSTAIYGTDFHFYDGRRDGYVKIVLDPAARP